MGIQPQDANSIEYNAQSPYIKRRQKLQEYVEALVETFQYENLLRDVTRNQLKRYQQVLELNDDDIELIPGILGNVLYNQGKLDEALTAYKEAIHLNPEDEVVRQNLGNVLIIRGHIEEAVIEYKEAIRIN
ncbi:MAG: tetratricopeptide repeat protein, partial [Nostoc sp.]